MLQSPCPGHLHKRNTTLLAQRFTTLRLLWRDSHRPFSCRITTRNSHSLPLADTRANSTFSSPSIFLPAVSPVEATAPSKALDPSSTDSHSHVQADLLRARPPHRPPFSGGNLEQRSETYAFRRTPGWRKERHSRAHVRREPCCSFDSKQLRLDVPSRPGPSKEQTHHGGSRKPGLRRCRGITGPGNALYQGILHWLGLSCAHLERQRLTRPTGGGSFGKVYKGYVSTAACPYPLMSGLPGH